MLTTCKNGGLVSNFFSQIASIISRELKFWILADLTDILLVKFEILFQKTMKLQICQKNVQKRVCHKIFNIDFSMSGEPKFQNSARLKVNGKNYWLQERDAHAIWFDNDLKNWKLGHTSDIAWYKDII